MSLPRWLDPLAALGKLRIELAKYGIGTGAALAITISWSLNHSILWAIVHGCFSWLYVLYFAFWLRD